MSASIKEVAAGVMQTVLDSDWLREHDRAVAEKAWEEGFDVAERDIFEHEKHDWQNRCIPNPYGPQSVSTQSDREETP